MPNQDDPYSVLGLSRDATQEQVVRAFRALARRHHPDAPGGDRAAYARVRRAYEVLIDRHRRSGDDMGGVGGNRAGDNRTDRRGPPPGRGVRIPVRVRHPRPRRGSDTEAVARVDLAHAVHGGSATADLGYGRTLDVVLPAGTEHRARLRVPGRGSPGVHGGPAGDLMVTVLVAEHPVYRRFGTDLRATLVLSYPEAVLGADVTITALDGEEITVPVPPGTAPGSALRLLGRGVPARTGSGTRGALILDATVDVPTGDLTPDQRLALEHLDSALPRPRKEPRR